jgi:hypothetical protein
VAVNVVEAEMRGRGGGGGSGLEVDFQVRRLGWCTG